MNLQPIQPLASRFVEFATIAMYVLALFNARGQGRRWLFTLLFSAVTGYFVEYFGVHGHQPRYSYGLEAFVFTFHDVPIFIALGWGLVFYAATWTAQRLTANAPRTGRGFWASLAASSAVAGCLGVNLDLSLDPVAQAHRFWSWTTWPGHGPHSWACPPNLPHCPPPPNEPGAPYTLLGVPYDNFIAWTFGIAMYGFLVRALFHWVNRRSAESTSVPGTASLNGTGGIGYDVLIPAVAGLGSLGVFVGIRGGAPKFYELIANADGTIDAGQTSVFATLFLSVLVVSWVLVLHGARGEEPNWVVLAIPAYFHITSFGLLLICKQVDKLSSLLILIPMAFVGGMLAYAWPSLDAITAALRRRALARAGLPDPVGLPPLVYKTLNSYGGAKVRALVGVAGNVRELVGLLAYARQSGKKVSFRAGGMAFDTQSLNDQIVMTLKGGEFEAIDVNSDAAEVTVGCAATWGRILEQTVKVGMVPFVMVTSSAATAGGTLSSNSIARFSASVGREGSHVRRFRLFTPDGNIVECEDDPRSANYELFLSVIGGLGYVGAVLDITYRLWGLPGADVAVKTTFTLVEGLAPVTSALLANAGNRFEALVKPFVRQVSAHCSTAAAPTPVPRAMSAAVNLRGGAWGLIADSCYVSGEKLKPSIFHSPSSVLHLALQFLAILPWLRSLGYKLTYRAYAGTHTYVDKPRGYTFFEDGNRKIRGLLQKLGVPTPLLQQTFVIPCDIANPQAAQANLVEFLREADLRFQSHEVDPALVDVVYVGRDHHRFVLSSSNDLDGFAVTFTFESLYRPLVREAKAMVNLARDCANRNGRVHLVKHVHAERDTIEIMYGAAMRQMNVIRQSRESCNVLENEFSGRVLRNI